MITLLPNKIIFYATKKIFFNFTTKIIFKTVQRFIVKFFLCYYKITVLKSTAQKNFFAKVKYYVIINEIF